MTTQTELRDALDFIKSQSGTGSKARKQEKFCEIYTEYVGHLVTGERYDDAGVGPATARKAVETVFGAVPDSEDTLSEGLATLDTDGYNSLETLVNDLDEVAELSGNEQQEALEKVLMYCQEPSLATLALLDDESLSLGTSQMRGAFFDGTRDERKHHESFTSSTVEFIDLAQDGELPDGPSVGTSFDPMLAVPESRGEPDNPVAQKKLDGYRVILHISENSAKAYSRRNNDITESLPELQDIDWPNGEYILDGEILAETGSYSDTSSRIGRKAENIDRDIEMNFEMFDLIYQNSDISSKSFEKRHAMLDKLLTAIDSEYLHLVEYVDDIEKAKDRAVVNNDEGIIVKDLKSPYEFGKRSTYWQKQKLDAECVDCVVSGFEEGKGKATGTLGKIALESADGVSLGSCGTGFTDEQRESVWNNQDKWLGQVVEIEGRGLGTNDNIRMPSFQRKRFEDGEADPFERVQELMKEI